LYSHHFDMQPFWEDSFNTLGVLTFSTGCVLDITGGIQIAISPKPKNIYYPIQGTIK
jgi:hypothetical protein